MTNISTVLHAGIQSAGLILVGFVVDVCAQESSAPVAVSTVVERELATGQSFVGTTMPSRTSIVGSAVDGRVVEFLVNEGDAVKRNQPLARLRTETLEIELAAAEAELKLRGQELAELENGSTTEELAQSQARMLAAKASMEYTLPKYERTASLFKQGRAVTQNELQEARAAAGRDEQSYLEAKAFHDLTLRGPRPERLAQAKTRVLIQQEQVRLIEDKISRHTIVAPFDGYVVAEHTEVGQWVREADPIVDIVELDEVDVKIFVLTKDVAHLRTRMQARVEVPALSAEFFSGEVTAVVPQADVRSRTFPVKVRVRNRSGNGGPVLKAGMLARVALPIGRNKRMTLVPKDALVLGGARPIVFVVDSNSRQPEQGVVRAVTVELGVADGNLIQVDGKLKPGERVVVRGNERLRPGQKVTITGVLEPNGSKSSAR